MVKPIGINPIAEPVTATPEVKTSNFWESSTALVPMDLFSADMCTILLQAGIILQSGDVAEWTMALVLKTNVAIYRYQRFESSRLRSIMKNCFDNAILCYSGSPEI